MSLALVQDYSSEEEVQERYLSDSDADKSHDEIIATPVENSMKFDDRNLNKGSLLPSAHDVFSEVTGPPEFLKSDATDPTPTRHRFQSSSLKQYAIAKPLKEQKRKSPPAAAVVESKAQLVGIHDRVRSDMENASQEETRRAPSVGLPPAEDAAKLLSLCLQCGVPKSYSSTKGMICPICKDQPAKEMENDNDKKRGSKIKDKEKSKRMKGQSTHATWKSETEMQLRQQFD